MADDARLLDYYERELDYLRNAGLAFAARHPKVARRLELSADQCADPHVERLLEGFAFLAARLHERIDDSLSDSANAMLEQLHPHAMRPLPSASIACFESDPTKGTLDAGYTIPRGKALFANVGGDSIPLRTCMPVTLWPLAIVGVDLLTDGFDHVTTAPEAMSVLKVSLRHPRRYQPAAARLPGLRFYIKGRTETSAALCDLVAGHTLAVKWRAPGNGGAVLDLPGVLPRMVGLESDEALLPEAGDGHPALRLLIEYFACPLKFQFFDIDCSSLQQPALAAGEGWDDSELFLVFNRRPRRELALKADDLRLGCAPVVNLFDRTSEPLRIDGRQTQYRLVADLHRERSTEIHSIEQVSCGDAGQPDQDAILTPYFSCAHGQAEGRYWHARREPSVRRDVPGTDLMLSLVDTGFDPEQAQSTVLYAKLLCTSRGLAEQLGADAALDIEDSGPLARVNLLHKPSRQVQPALDGAARWQLVSQLSLSHLSLVDGPQALAYLKELLTLCNPARELVADSQIRGIRALSCQAVVRHVEGDAWQGYRNGYRVTLALEPALLRGSSKLLFGAVLHRFLALFAGINTFIELRLDCGDDSMYDWPAQPGWRIAL